MNAIKTISLVSAQKFLRCEFVLVAIQVSPANRCRLLLLILLLLGGPAISATPADRIDAYIEAQLKRQEIPGLALAVVREGKVEKAKGYGLADVELNVPVTERSVFQWASITKQFTATAIMQLVQDGKLSLDDQVNRHYTNAPAAWSHVTVRHLLTHTSGIKSYTALPDFFGITRKD